MLGGALFSFPEIALFVLVAVFMVNSAFCAPPFCCLDPVRLFVGLSIVLLMFFVRGCSVFISSGCSVRFVAVFIVKSVPYAPPFCCSVCCLSLLWVGSWRVFMSSLSIFNGLFLCLCFL